jgi:rare lipoprotein A
MKHLMVSIVLLWGLCFTGSAPASADVYDNLLRDISRGSLASSGERGSRPRVSDESRETRQHRRRVARATISDDEDFDYQARRPVRETRKASRRSRERATQRAVLKRPRAVTRPDRTKTAAPKWTKRSLAATKGSGSVHTGVASFYWQGQRVASGGWFNPNGMTAAHRTLPFGTRVRVHHMGNGRSVDVVINDRGPYIAGRIIDLSKGAAQVIGMTAQGLARVKVMILGR